MRRGRKRRFGIKCRIAVNLTREQYAAVEAEAKAADGNLAEGARRLIVRGLRISGTEIDTLRQPSHTSLT